jgi:hypothetical protein
LPIFITGSSDEGKDLSHLISVDGGTFSNFATSLGLSIVAAWGLLFIFAPFTYGSGLHPRLDELYQVLLSESSSPAQFN